MEFGPVEELAERLALMIFGSPNVLAAYTKEGDGAVQAITSCEYTIDEENRTVTLTKYVGTEAAVAIPASYRVDETTYSVIVDSSICFVSTYQ